MKQTAINNSQTLSQLDKTIKPKLIPKNKSINYFLESSDGWPLEILNTLQKDSLETDLNEGKLEIELKLERFYTSELSEYILIEGVVTANYNTPCVRCLETTRQFIDFNFKACVLEHELQESDNFKEEASINVSDDDYDLFFINEKFELDLHEIVSEQIFLSIDNFPLHDPDCKGLCSICGINLNNNSCEHSN